MLLTAALTMVAPSQLNSGVEAIKNLFQHALCDASRKGNRAMARNKPQDHNSLLLPAVLSEQVIPGAASPSH